MPNTIINSDDLWPMSSTLFDSVTVLDKDGVAVTTATVVGQMLLTSDETTQVGSDVAYSHAGSGVYTAPIPDTVMGALTVDTKYTYRVVITESAKKETRDRIRTAQYSRD